jgi:hypothetical protein
LIWSATRDAPCVRAWPLAGAVAAGARPFLCALVEEEERPLLEVDRCLVCAESEAGNKPRATIDKIKARFNSLSSFGRSDIKPEIARASSSNLSDARLFRSSTNYSERPRRVKRRFPAPGKAD